MLTAHKAVQRSSHYAFRGADTGALACKQPGLACDTARLYAQVDATEVARKQVINIQTIRPLRGPNVLKG